MSVSIDDSTTTTTPLEVMRRMFDEGFSTGDGAVVDELCSPDLVDHQFGMAGRGEEARNHVRAAMRDVHGAFPDVRFTIEDWVIDGDMIWVRAHGRGTATGPYFGPPSGRKIDFYVLDIARIQNGQIAEHWGVPDRFAVMAQTGLLDRLAATATAPAQNART